jgi:subtilisin family serine protease
MIRIVVSLIIFGLALLYPSSSVIAKPKTLTVAVIDTGIDKQNTHLCKFGHKSFSDSDPFPLNDNHGHGTHVAGLIEQNAGGGAYCLVSIKFHDPHGTGKQNLDNFVKAIRYAINIKVDFINISGGGDSADLREHSLIVKALNNGIKVVVAAGNEASNLETKCNYFPACYDQRLVVVGNLENNSDISYRSRVVYRFNEVSEWHNFGASNTHRSPSSNYGYPVNRWEIGTNVTSNLPNGKSGEMTGTSQATGVATGKLIKERLSK